MQKMQPVKEFYDFILRSYAGMNEPSGEVLFLDIFKMTQGRKKQFLWLVRGSVTRKNRQMSIKLAQK